MTTPTNREDALNVALAELIRSYEGRIFCGARAITPGDEFRLTQAERSQMSTSVDRVLRASAAARILARQLFRAAAAPAPADICKGKSGAPIWPDGFAGSISHDDDFAIAAISRTRDFRSIGIDVEPCTPLPRELSEIVAKPSEISQADKLRMPHKLLFCIKEAVYKAVNPIYDVFLDYHDIEFCFDDSSATVFGSNRIKIATKIYPRLLALATIS